jgi:hypothetical protein
LKNKNVSNTGTLSAYHFRELRVFTYFDKYTHFGEFCEYNQFQGVEKGHAFWESSESTPNFREFGE